MLLSTCITVKNRSRQPVDGRELRLLPTCVRSLVDSARQVPVPVELVVTDWHSEDWPLREWLPQVAGQLPCRIIDLDGATFSRGQGLNAAARAARGDVLFFTDADSLICPEVMSQGLRHVEQGKAFSPVFYYFEDPEHRTGRWCHTAFGNAVVSREVFEKSGGWPEYKRYGREDVHFFERLKTIVPMVREEVPGFCHQWHPQDILWKDRYGDRTAEEIEEIQQTRVAARELAGVVPPARTLILVDEARFGISQIEGRRVLPFLEHDGDYAGAPPDDQTAIRELERLRDAGAGFIAFAWMAFWWLDYYTGLREYLLARFPRVFQNERLIVFRLRSEP